MRVFSGVRPTGDIHLGNYLGAIKQWVQLVLGPSVNERIFCIVDQHALTTRDDATKLQHSTFLVAAAYIASGLSPEENIIFVQGHVPFHVELSWYLSCMTPLGWLNRMTQFKEKSGKDKSEANLGLYAYPVLMAADILLYNATHVPVGEDQKQHVELARDIAQRVNSLYGESIFTLPLPIVQKEGARIMSLRDGKKKMSKSEPSEYSRIHLFDTDDQIREKIKKAKTDAMPISSSVEDLKERFEVLNLLTIYAATQGIEIETACARCAGLPFAAFKDLVSDAIIAEVAPIRLKMVDLLKNRDYLASILKDGALKARALAEPFMKNIRSLFCLMPFE